MREVSLAAEINKKPTQSDVRVAWALAGASRTAKARACLEKAVENPKARVAAHAAEVFAVLGDSDRAFDSLYRAYQLRDASVALIKVEPKLDPLRGDPRFDELLTRLRLQ